MKTIEDIKLEAKVSDMIVAAFDGLTIAFPEGEVLSRGDLVDISEALAMKIIKIVKEAA